ncbi:MAG TPA: HAMP domain-containing methyl-accepting chemotaxis protein [Gemmatimonadales bacterium]|jgi:methyl-accepting chemotaxis protein|nr:HAMP domain-containing methyl-accepting chemotaxis protein [Gemmatimonadales bacterium]
MRPFDSLARRIGAGMLVLLALVFALALLAVSAIRSLDRSVGEELGVLLRTTSLGSALVASVTSQIRTAEEYLDHPSAQGRTEFVRTGDSAYIYQRRYRDLPSLTTSDRFILNRIGASQARLEVAYAQAHALVDLGRREDARAFTALARPAADTLIADVQALTLAQTNRSMARAAELKASAERRRALLWLFFFLSFGVAAATAYTTIRSVNLPLRRLIGAADRFGSGDLRPVKLGAMPSELERLARAMDEMGGRLRSVVQAVVHEATHMSGSASDFSAMSEQLTASSGEISTAMVRMAASAEQQVAGMRDADALLLSLRGTAERNAQAAGKVVAVGERIRGLAAQHRTSVHAAGESLLDVREVVRTSAAQVQQLAQLSESITDFIDLIKQISSQTNLLALNAAIEAARAGEHGRGFAVVAEEVRRLADSSAAAAEDVTQTIEVIRSRIREVAATMEVGSAKVSGVEGVATGAARALEEIATAVEDASAVAAEVAREAAENRRIVDEVGNKTAAASQAAAEHAALSQEVTAAAEEQSASTEQIASSAGDLLQAAQRLTALMADFRT